MRLLLDTNIFVFLRQNLQAIPPRTLAILADPGNERFLSLVTPWELQIKASIGKFVLGQPIRDMVQFEIARGAMTLLPITLDHIDALSLLPDHHRDPFDRLLIAQAIDEDLTLVTSDQQIAKYPVTVLWG